MTADFALLLLGLLAQGLFGCRNIVQWIQSERSRSVQNPLSFWVISIIACVLMFFYGYLRHDYIIMIGQYLSFVVYAINLKLKKFLPSSAIYAISAAFICAGAWMLSLHLSEVHLQSSFELNGKGMILLVGIVGQILWSGRMFYQLAVSVARGESRLSLGFWVISLAGCLLLLVYAALKLDLPFAIGQISGIIPILRNLQFSINERRNNL